MDDIFQQQEEMRNDSGHDLAECYFNYIQSAQNTIDALGKIASELKEIRKEFALLEEESWKH